MFPLYIKRLFVSPYFRSRLFSHYFLWHISMNKTQIIDRHSSTQRRPSFIHMQKAVDMCVCIYIYINTHTYIYIYIYIYIYMVHETAISHNSSLQSFSGDRKQPDRSFVDRHSSKLSFYENIRTSSLSWHNILAGCLFVTQLSGNWRIGLTNCVGYD